MAHTDFSWKEEKVKKPLSLGLVEILNSDKNVACILLFLLVLPNNSIQALSTGDMLVQSNEQFNNKITSAKPKNDLDINTLKNIPDISPIISLTHLEKAENFQDFLESKNVSQNFLNIPEENKIHSQTIIKESLDEISQDMAYKGFENRMFNVHSHETIEDNFGEIIFNEEMNNSIEAAMNEEHDFEMKSRELNFGRTSEKRKKSFMKDLK